MGYVLLLFVTQSASLAPADRFTLIIEGLCHAVAWRGGILGRVAAPLIILIWSRLRRIATRFAHIATTAPSPARPRPGRLRRSPPLPLPRRKAWLLRLAPEVASGASQLRHFLADPEVATLLAADPRFGRILRPLCFALGIRAAGIRAAGIRFAQALPPPDAAPSVRPIPYVAPEQAPPATAPPAAYPPSTTPPWPDLAPASA
jgi:hypothetical protein